MSYSTPELHVRIVSARNLADTQMFGTQDPYCKIKVGKTKFKTRVHDNGGRSPTWNEKFVFPVYDPQLDQISISIKNKNFTDSTPIGDARVPISMFLNGQLYDQWFPVMYRGRQRGEINLRAQLVGYNTQPSQTQSTPQTYPTYQGQAAPTAPTAPPADYYNSYNPEKEREKAWKKQQKQQQQQQAYAAPAPVAQAQAYPPPPYQQYPQQPPPPPPPHYQYPPPPPPSDPYYHHHHHHHPPPPHYHGYPGYEHGGYYERRYDDRYDNRGRQGYGSGSGSTMAGAAAGAGVGLLGGMLLGEALDDGDLF